MKDPILKEIDELRELVNKACYSYHIVYRPIMSDSDFDKLFQRLIELEKRYPHYSNMYSPTQQVGHKPGKGFRKVKHRQKLLSLDNLFNAQDVTDFVTRFPNELFVLDPKYDGLALNLTYIDGELTTAATRGDGEIGEDITANILKLNSVPHRLVGQNIPRVIEIRGECVFPKARFEMVNDYLAATKKKLYSNARNAVAGIARQKSSAAMERTQPDFVAYGIGYSDRPLASTHDETVNILNGFGFISSIWNMKTVMGEEVNDQISKTFYSVSIPYDTDGMVIRINSLERQEEIGNTSHHPKFAMAYKFPSVPVNTLLRGVDLQVGRTGVITPVAILDPVVVGSVTVSRVTLHNFDEIARLDLRIKDTVEVIRSGEVIPKIVGVVKHLRPKRAILIPTPTHCPSCNTALLTDNVDEVAIYCSNGIGCPAQRQRILEHFVSRKALDITGIGEALVEKMLNGYPYSLARPSDLFFYSLPDLKNNFGLTDGVAKNVFNAIQASRRVKLDRVIYALGIRHVGSERAKVLASKVPDLKTLPNLTYEELVGLGDIGDEVALSIMGFFRNLINRDECIRLDNALMIELPEKNAIVNQPLKGNRIAITGSFVMPRELIIDRLEKLGAKVVSSISLKTDILFVGENAGSKAATAKKLHITCYDEGELMGLIGD